MEVRFKLEGALRYEADGRARSKGATEPGKG
jgi:hypothetical protein